jgi:GntR family transcriptional regulator
VEVPGFELQEGPVYPYVQVANDLEGRIRRGELAPGTRLPSERAMAELYGVALGTMRKAIRILAGKGLLVVTPNLGVFVNPDLELPRE